MKKTKTALERNSRQLIPFVWMLTFLISCNPLSDRVGTPNVPVNVDVTLVTSTLIYTPSETTLPTLTLSPTSIIPNATPIGFTETHTPTPTYPLLRIVDWDIKQRNCKQGKVDTVTIELVLEGGLSPYNYNTNISVDEQGIAHAVVVSSDKQSATANISVSNECGGSDRPITLTSPPIVITSPPIVITSPPIVITNPPVVKTSVSPRPTSTPDFPQSECNDDYDNDGDGKIDFPDDPDCKSSNDNGE